MQLLTEDLWEWCWEGRKAGEGEGAADGNCRREGNPSLGRGRGGHQPICPSPRTGSTGEWRGFHFEVVITLSITALWQTVPALSTAFWPSPPWISHLRAAPTQCHRPHERGTRVWSCYMRWCPDISWAHAHTFCLCNNMRCSVDWRMWRLSWYRNIKAWLSPHSVLWCCPCSGLRIKETKEVYEGEVTELTPCETENPMGGYGKTISHVIIGLKTGKGTKQLKVRLRIFFFFYISFKLVLLLHVKHCIV